MHAHLLKLCSLALLATPLCAAELTDFNLIEPPAVEALDFAVIEAEPLPVLEIALLECCDCEVTGECMCEDCQCEGCPNRKAQYDARLIAFGKVDCAQCPKAKAACQAANVRYVDVDREPELARRYNVRALPALVRLDNGRKAGHFEGLTGFANKLAEWQGKRPAKADPVSFYQSNSRRFVPLKYRWSDYPGVPAFHVQSRGACCPR